MDTGYKNCPQTVSQHYFHHTSRSSLTYNSLIPPSHPHFHSPLDIPYSHYHHYTTLLLLLLLPPPPPPLLYLYCHPTSTHTTNYTLLSTVRPVSLSHLTDFINLPTHALRMCIRITERFAVCGCTYFVHGIDQCQSVGRQGHSIQEKTVLVGYKCEYHSRGSSHLGVLPDYTPGSSSGYPYR